MMQDVTFNRRQMLLGTAASLAGRALTGTTVAAPLAQAAASSTAPMADQVRRMQWWHAAKFGMFIHFGVYSTIGRHEWVNGR
jgi:alpha-L-fucosidase